jgi:hypothetical protein
VNFVRIKSSRIAIMKSVGILLAVLLSLSTSTPSLASGQSLVVGNLLTENNEPVASTNVNFYSKADQLWTNSKTDKNGRFLAQLPKGEYSVSISGYSSNTGRCLNAGFNYSVVSDRQTLNIKTPKFKSYKIQYVDAASNSAVANVTTTLHNLYYKAVENPDLGQVKFFCSRQAITSAISSDWEAFEVDALETAKERKGYDLRSNFMYRNGLGQMVTTNIVEVDWNSPQIVFALPDLPSVNINKKSLKVSGGTLSGQATFTEAEALAEFQINRKFRVTFRVIRGARVTNWILANPKFTSIKGNTVSFRLNTQYYKGAKVEFMLAGSNYSLGTNFFTLNIPK